MHVIVCVHKVICVFTGLFTSSQMTQFHNDYLGTLVRAPVSQLNSCAVLSNLGQIHTLHSFSSLNSINNYLAINNSGNVCTNSLYINCSMAGYFPEKSKLCLIEQVCQRVKYKVLWAVVRQLLLCIRSYPVL